MGPSFPEAEVGVEHQGGGAVRKLNGDGLDESGERRSIEPLAHELVVHRRTKPLGSTADDLEHRGQVLRGSEHLHRDGPRVDKTAAAWCALGMMRLRLLAAVLATLPLPAFVFASCANKRLDFGVSCMETQDGGSVCTTSGGLEAGLPGTDGGRVRGTKPTSTQPPASTGYTACGPSGYCPSGEMCDRSDTVPTRYGCCAAGTTPDQDAGMGLGCVYPKPTTVQASCPSGYSVSCESGSTTKCCMNGLQCIDGICCPAGAIAVDGADCIMPMVDCNADAGSVDHLRTQRVRWRRGDGMLP